MNQRERTNDDQQKPTAPPGGPENSGELKRLTDEGASFLAAGQAIINAALSGDSQAFLQANRQSGGQ